MTIPGLLKEYMSASSHDKPRKMFRFASVGFLYLPVSCECLFEEGTAATDDGLVELPRLASAADRDVAKETRLQKPRRTTIVRLGMEGRLHFRREYQTHSERYFISVPSADIAIFLE